MRKHATTHDTESAENEVGIHEEPELAELREALQTAIHDRDRYQDQMLRTMADFQNFKKRVQVESEQLRSFATERLVTQLLPVLDNFERTIAAFEAGATIDSVVGGIKAVDRQIRSVLEAHNVARIPSHGEPFNPDVHEAIATEISEEHPEGTVLNEIEAGYKMADKVIRPARVKVSKKQ